MSIHEHESDAERLLELHDELDRMVSASEVSPWWIVVWIVAFVMMGRAFVIAVQVGVGLEFGLVFLLGALGVSVPFVLQRRRIRSLRDRIAEFEVQRLEGGSENGDPP